MNPAFLLALPEYRVDSQMGGIGVRALDLAYALSEFGSVTIVASFRCDLRNLPFSVVSSSDADLYDLLQRADVVIVFDMGSIQLLEMAVRLNKYIVLENAVPIEHLEYNYGTDAHSSSNTYRSIVHVFAAQVVVADHLLLRSNVEYRTMVACLALLTRLGVTDLQISRTLAHLMTVVRIGFSRHEDVPAALSVSLPPTILWTGGVWDYMAPEALLKGHRALEARSVGSRVAFLYPPARNQGLRAEQVLSSLNPEFSNASFVSPTPNHLERGFWIQRAQILACLGRPGIENDTCVRLRIRDSLLYRRPVVVDPFGATADYVRHTGIGVVTHSLEPHDVAAALHCLLSEPALYNACLSAIESERSRCVVEDSLLPFVAAGHAVHWRPLRSATQKVHAMSAIKTLYGSSPDTFRLPFSV